MSDSAPFRGAGSSAERSSPRRSTARSARGLDATLVELCHLVPPIDAGGAPADLRTTLIAPVRLLSKALGAQWVAVWRRDGDLLRCECALAKNGAEAEQLEVPDDSALTTKWRRARTVVSSDPTAHPIGAALARISTSKTGAGSLCDAPLMIEGSVVGVLTIGRERTGRTAFTPSERAFIASAADRLLGMIERHECRSIGHELVRRQDELRDAHKLQTLGLLAAGAAHDFNNSLTALYGYVQLLAENVTSDPKSRLQATNALRTIDHAAALIQQILAFGRDDGPSSDPADIDDTLAKVEPVLRSLAHDRLSIEVEPALGSVNVPPVRLTQIFLNLTLNARDATSENRGRVRLTVTDADPADLDLGPGGYVLIRVDDDGTGMDEATRRQVLEPGFTTKETGSGLGLSIVTGIAREAGGTISVASSLGRGATVEVVLPRLPTP